MSAYPVFDVEVAVRIGDVHEDLHFTTEQRDSDVCLEFYEAVERLHLEAYTRTLEDEK